MPTTTQERVALGLVLVLFGAALVLRVLALGHGYQSDEISLLRSPSSLWNDTENGINPPLHRLIVQAWLSDEPALRFGRALSFVCGVGALWFSYQIGRSIGGNHVSGAMALALAAFTDVVIEHAALTRVYSVWFLVATWHVYAALRWLAAPDERRCAVELAVSAALLPHLHYLSIPILAIEGIVLSLVSRRWTLVAKCWTPAMVATIPLVLLMLRAPAPGQPSVGGGEAWQRTSLQVLGLGSSHGQALVVGLLVFAAFRWKRLDAFQHYASICLLGAVGVVIGVGAFRLVRPPAAHMVLPYACAAMAGLPRALQGIWRITLQVVLTVGLLFPRAEEAMFRRNVTEWDGIEAFANTWRSREGERPESVLIVPSHMGSVLELYLTGQVTSTQRFEHAGTTFLGGDGSSAKGADIAVIFGERVPDVPGCEKESSGPRFQVLSCKTPAW